MRKTILTLIWLLPFVVQAQPYSQGPFAVPSSVPAASHPFILYTTQAEIDSLRQRCIGALSRAPYTTWYSSLLSDAQSFRDTDGPSLSDQYEHGLGMLNMALAWIISEDGSFLTKLTTAGWMDGVPVWHDKKSDGELWKVIAYDIIADSITAGQRTNIYNAQKGHINSFNPSVTSRHGNAMIITAALSVLAGLAYEDEDASQALTWLRRGVAGIDSSLQWFTRGGVWAEGAYYGKWCASMLFYAMVAYDNQASVNLWDADVVRDYLFWAGTSMSGRRTEMTWTYDNQVPRHPNNFAIWPALINANVVPQDTARIIRGYHDYYLNNLATIGESMRGSRAANIAYYHDTQVNSALTPDTTSVFPSIYNERAGQLYFADNYNGRGIEGVFTFETWYRPETFHEHKKGLGFEIWHSDGATSDEGALVTLTQPGYGYTDVNNWFKNWNDHNVLSHTSWSDNATHNDDSPILGGATEKFSVAVGNYEDPVNNVSWQRMILPIRGEDIVLFADWMEDLGGTNRNWNSYMRIRYGTPGNGGSGTYSDAGDKQWAEYDTLGVETRIHFLLPDVSTISTSDSYVEYRFSGYFWPATHLSFSGTGFNSKSTLVTSGAIQVQPTAESYYTYVESTNGGVLDDGSIEYNILTQSGNTTLVENNMVTNGHYAVVADNANTVQWFFTYDATNLAWNGSTLWNANAELDGVMISVTTGASGKWEGLIKENNPVYTLNLYTPSQPDSILINGTKYTNWIWNSSRAQITITESGTYKICADYGAGDCGSTAITPTPPGGEDPPAAPTALSFTGITQTAMTIQWQDNSNNEDEFRLYWGTSATKPASHNATVGQNITTFNLTGLNCNTQYYVWVEAWNTAGSADNSDNRTTLACTDPPAGTPDTGPNYPRISSITFYGIDGTDVWDYHDLVGLRYYHIASATKLRTSNPDVVIMALNDEIRGGDEGTIRKSFPNDKYPTAWRVKTTANEYLQFTPNAYLMNVTSTCPDTMTEFGSMNFSEYLPRALVAYSDTTLFDGTFFDFWASTITNTWSKHATVDLNVNGVADASEGGVNAKWQQGNSYLIKQMQSVWKGTWATEPIIAHEMESSLADSMNGWGNENWRGRSWDTEVSQMSTQESANKSPKMGQLEMAWTYTDNDNLGDGSPNGSDYYTTPLKNQFQYVRYGLGTAGLLGLYFGVDEGAAAHRFAGLAYDEYLADIGLPSGAYESVARNTRIKVRYFEGVSDDTLGVLIVNTAGDTSKVYDSDLQAGTWYHFRGNQDPTVNDGSVFDSYVLQGSGGVNSATQTGDGLLLLTSLDTLVAPIIIGNQDYNVTSPGSNAADFQGGWASGMVSTTHHGVRIGWGGEAGESYKYATSAQFGAATYADFVPTINVSGTYEVFEWHNYPNDETVGGNPIGDGGNTTYRIFHDGGQADSTVDQSANYEQWNSLGTFTFTAGNGKVRILTTGAAGTVVVADAVKFVLQTASTTAPGAAGRRRSGTVND